MPHLLLVPLLLLLPPLLLFPSVSHSKHIIVYIDGTGDSPDSINVEDGEAATNIQRLFEITVNDPVSQHAIYIPGLATHPASSRLDLTNKREFYFGRGAKAKRNQAYKQLASHYQQGDRVSLFGFSRGAAIVRDLANYIADKGIGNQADIPIEMVGLFDCVASFGIPIDIGILPTQRINLGKNFVLPDTVKAAYHAVAMHELRSGFEPTLVNPRFEEVWFAGSHKDIGGGYVERGMANVTLLYMMERARQHGIEFVQNHPYSAVDPLQPGPDMFMFRHRGPDAQPSSPTILKTRALTLAPGFDTVQQKIKLHASVAHWARRFHIEQNTDPQQYDIVE